MTADIGRHRGGALESAKSRRYVAGNAIFCSDRSSQYTTGRSRVGARQRRAPVVQPHRQLPRQHRSRVVLRHGEERDVLQGKLRYQGRRQACRHRAHRGRLRPEKALRPSVTRCPRMPWSRSSSTRSLNRNCFPLPPSSSILPVRKLDTDHIGISGTATLLSIKDSSLTLALHRRFEVCRTLLLENCQPNAFLRIERNKQRQGPKQQQLQMWHSYLRRMSRQSQHKRGRGQHPWWLCHQGSYTDVPYWDVEAVKQYGTD